MTLNADEAFWVDLAPYIYNQPHLNSGREIDQIIKLLPLAPQCRILDAACGMGRHALECAQRGFTVTAYDINAGLIEENRRKSLEKDLTVDWIQANMQEFCRPDHYDAVFSLFYSFGYSEHPEADLHILHKFYQSLRPGGKIIMQLMGRELIEKWLQPKYWSLEPDDTLILVEKQFNPESALLNETVFILKDGERKKYQLTTRVYYAFQIAEMLHQAGFRQLQLFGNFEGGDYNEKANSLVVTGQRPLQTNIMIRC